MIQKVNKLIYNNSLSVLQKTNAKRLLNFENEGADFDFKLLGANFGNFRCSDLHSPALELWTHVFQVECLPKCYVAKGCVLTLHCCQTFCKIVCGGILPILAVGHT